LIESPEFECAGHKWKLQLHIAENDGDTFDGFIAVYLFSVLPSESSEIRLADVSFNIKKSDGQNYLVGESDWMSCCDFGPFTFTSVQPSDGTDWFVKYRGLFDEDSDVLEFGTLTIEVRMRLDLDHYCHDDKPQTSLTDNMLKLFLEENTEDVAFKVKGKIVKAHKTVLRAHAKELAELCEAFDLSNPMRINDVDHDTFQLMIGFVYGEKILTETWKEQVQYIVDPTKQKQSILFASGKYGVTALKSKAEAWCVKFLELNFNTAIDHLLYADANSLPLLKKAAMDYITCHGKQIMTCESFQLLKESPVLMEEVMRELIEQLETLKRKRDE
jgi:hypothetical protein